MRLGIFFLFLTLLGPARANGAGERETRALQACLFDYPQAEHQCFEVPYYTCMGEQLGISPNPNLASERCLYQELVVWNNLLREVCDVLEAAIEKGTSPLNVLCLKDNARDWSSIARGLANSNEELISRQNALRLSSGETRSSAVQLRRLFSS